MALRITFITADGDEGEETWPSVERFRSWAISEELELTFTAYEEDGDEWVVVAKGRVTLC